MARSARSLVLLGSVVTSIALLGACGKKAPEVPSTPPPTASTTATAPTAAPSGMPPATASANAPLAPKPAMTGTSATASASSIAVPAGSASVAAAEAPAPISVIRVNLGDSVDSAHEVAHNSDHFSADDKTIYATVATTGHGSDVKLSAKWSYLEGKGQVISDISQALTTSGPAFTTFKVENPDLWPEGKYRVEIALNGHTVSKQDFRVGKR